MPPALKRARTSSISPPTTASQAVQQAIASLAASSSTLDPGLFSQLLGSLHDAHAIALEQEGVVMKEEAKEDSVDQQAIATPQLSPQPQLVAPRIAESNRWWTRTLQFDEKTDPVVKRVLEDIEAGMPKLDELVRFVIPPLLQITDASVPLVGYLVASSMRRRQDRLDGLGVCDSWERFMVGKLVQRELPVSLRYVAHSRLTY